MVIFPVLTDREVYIILTITNISQLLSHRTAEFVTSTLI